MYHIFSYEHSAVFYNPIAIQLLGVNATLYVARKRKSGLKPYLKRVIVWSIRGFNMKLNGAGPATAALGIGFNLLAKVYI